MYTTYRYRLTVFNDFGHTASEPSDEATTFGGVPRRAAEVAAYSVNHTTIEVRWQVPGKFRKYASDIKQMRDENLIKNNVRVC